MPTLPDQGAETAGCLTLQAVPGSGAGAVKVGWPIALGPRPAVAAAGAGLLLVVLCGCKGGSLSRSSELLELLALLAASGLTIRGTKVNGVLLLRVGLLMAGAIATGLVLGEI